MYMKVEKKETDQKNEDEFKTRSQNVVQQR
jgi:hypothetical protein